MRLLVTAAALILAGCGSDSDAPKSAGESGVVDPVQGGTISDAMLPLPTVTSTSPPAVVEVEEDEAESGGEEASGDEERSGDEE